MPCEETTKKHSSRFPFWSIEIVPKILKSEIGWCWVRKATILLDIINTVASKLEVSFLLIREYHNENRIEDTNYGKIEKEHTPRPLSAT